MGQFVDFINTGDLELGKSIISHEVIFYAPTSPELMKGFDGYSCVLDMMRGAMPDVHWTVEEMIAEGDKVMVSPDKSSYGNTSHRKGNQGNRNEYL